MELKKAQRKQVKLKLQIGGASGSGKTMGALKLAYGLVGDWGKIAVIDTENESSSLYVNKNGIGEFNVINLTEFDEKSYIKALDLCLEHDIECVIIDTSTRLWDYLLELQSKLGGRYQDWAEPKAKHKKYVAKMLNSPIHVISTVRKKEDYILEQEEINGRTKNVIKKIGLKEQQEGNLTYEFTIVFDVDQSSHLTTCSKDRTGLFDGKEPFLLSEETGKMIKEWCNEGVEQINISPYLKEINDINSLENLTTFWQSLDDDLKNNVILRNAVKEKKQIISTTKQ